MENWPTIQSAALLHDDGLQNWTVALSLRQQLPLNPLKHKLKIWMILTPITEALRNFWVKSPQESWVFVQHSQITRGFPSWGYGWSREPRPQTSHTQENDLLQRYLSMASTLSFIDLLDPSRALFYYYFIHGALFPLIKIFLFNAERVNWLPCLLWSLKLTPNRPIL